jgi:hypothetical protein
MILGIDQPTIVGAIIPYNGIQYFEGIAGGSSLKFAVKVPNFVTLSFASGLSDDLRCKNSKNESKEELGRETVISVELNYPPDSPPNLQIQNLQMI